MWRVLKLGARAAIWRITSDPPLVGLPVLLAFAAILATVRIALQLAESGSWLLFTPYGLNAVIAWIAVELAVAALFVRPDARATALSAMFVLSYSAKSPRPQSASSPRCSPLERRRLPLGSTRL